MHAPSRLWLARDMSGSGLYTIWINSEPEINHDGYYKYSESSNHISLLLVTIHPSKLPWEYLSLDRGECIELELLKVETDTHEMTKPTNEPSNTIEGEVVCP